MWVQQLQLWCHFIKRFPLLMNSSRNALYIHRESQQWKVTRFNHPNHRRSPLNRASVASCMLSLRIVSYHLLTLTSKPIVLSLSSNTNKLSWNLDGEFPRVATSKYHTSNSDWTLWPHQPIEQRGIETELQPNWVSLLNACLWGKPLLAKEWFCWREVSLPQKTVEARCSNTHHRQKLVSLQTIKCIAHVGLQKDPSWAESSSASIASPTGWNPQLDRPDEAIGRMKPSFFLMAHSFAP